MTEPVQVQETHRTTSHDCKPLQQVWRLPLQLLCADLFFTSQVPSVLL
jgi:hypothetical protein